MYIQRYSDVDRWIQMYMSCQFRYVLCDVMFIHIYMHCGRMSCLLCGPAKMGTYMNRQDNTSVYIFLNLTCHVYSHIFILAGPHRF